MYLSKDPNRNKVEVILKFVLHLSSPKSKDKRPYVIVRFLVR